MLCWFLPYDCVNLPWPYIHPHPLEPPCRPSRSSQSTELSALGYTTAFHKLFYTVVGLPWQLRWERACLQRGRPGFDLWVGKMPWRRKWQPTPVFLPGEFHGWRSLVGYGPWGRTESDVTERLTLLALVYMCQCCSPSSSYPLLPNCVHKSVLAGYFKK